MSAFYLRWHYLFVHLNIFLLVWASAIAAASGRQLLDVGEATTSYEAIAAATDLINDNLCLMDHSESSLRR